MDESVAQMNARKTLRQYFEDIEYHNVHRKVKNGMLNGDLSIQVMRMTPNVLEKWKKLAEMEELELIYWTVDGQDPIRFDAFLRWQGDEIHHPHQIIHPPRMNE
jgi:hypothetical protein